MFININRWHWTEWILEHKQFLILRLWQVHWNLKRCELKKLLKHAITLTTLEAYLSNNGIVVIINLRTITSHLLQTLWVSTSKIATRDKADCLIEDGSTRSTKQQVVRFCVCLLFHLNLTRSLSFFFINS